MVLVQQTMDDGQAVGEIFSEISTLEVGNETVSDFLHGRQNALKSFNGVELLCERRRIGTLVIVEYCRDSSCGDRQDAEQAKELFVHINQQL